jgi:hypothetical protein
MMMAPSLMKSNIKSTINSKNRAIDKEQEVDIKAKVRGVSWREASERRKGSGDGVKIISR